VLSNANINSSSDGSESPFQVETDFLVAPGPALTITLSLAQGGELELSSTTAAAYGLSFVDIVEVRSTVATVRASKNGFTVDVPASVSEEAPAHVDVDVRLPAETSESYVAFDSWFCSERDPSGECLAGRPIQRGIPFELALP
jgi:hypothetical protein